MDASESIALQQLATRSHWGVDELPLSIGIDVLRGLDDLGLIEVRYVTMVSQGKYPGDPALATPSPSTWFSPIRNPTSGGPWDAVLARKERSPQSHPDEIRLSDRGRAEVSRLGRAREAARAPKWTWEELRQQAVKFQTDFPDCGVTLRFAPFSTPATFLPPGMPAHATDAPMTCAGSVFGGQQVVEQLWLVDPDLPIEAARRSWTDLCEGLFGLAKGVLATRLPVSLNTDPALVPYALSEDCASLGLIAHWVNWQCPAGGPTARCALVAIPTSEGSRPVPLLLPEISPPFPDGYPAAHRGAPPLPGVREVGWCSTLQPAGQALIAAIEWLLPRVLSVAPTPVPVSLLDDDWVSQRRLAEYFGVPLGTLGKHLPEWRDEHLNNDWLESPNRRSRDAKFLYRVGSIRPLLESLKQRGNRDGISTE